MLWSPQVAYAGFVTLVQSQERLLIPPSLAGAAGGLKVIWQDRAGASWWTPRWEKRR
ncbi:MAG: hypothetical protein IMX01_02790 [Limnochordaceae bacterium]|nr:hypothetical protein [Limnochordaceae bacterium]